MALSGRLRVIVTTLVPLLNRSERLAAFQVYSPRPGKPPSCNTYSCDRVPGRTNTGGATATGDRCCRIFRSSQRRPLQPLQRSLRPTSTASSAGGQLSGDTSRERGGGSIRRTAVSDASGEVVAAADQPQEKLALTMEDARKALKSLFGHDDFRDGQAAVVTKLISGESCAAIFPTGAGKSICYQLPGTLMAERGLGLTLVVSPLIALMKDQTDALIAAGVPCAKLDSTLAAHEIREIYEQIRAGVISLLYVSPERFNNERFIRALKGVKVALFVVDEAHCISEWGHNFRPDYLRLADFAGAANANARLALTATATPKVEERYTGCNHKLLSLVFPLLSALQQVTSTALPVVQKCTFQHHNGMYES